jgi:hypothetical protein
MNSNYKILRISSIFAFIVTIIVNASANIIPLNGITTGELSDKYGNLFTPAGYVFSIWVVIYILLAAFTFYQYSEDDKEIHEKIGWLFVISCFFNSIWMFFWHYEILSLSIVAMAGILVCLILIYTRLEIGLVEVSKKKLYMVHTPFSVYLGWITVAPIANVAALLVANGWDGFNLTAVYITVAMIIIALVLTLVNTYVRGDVAYAAVLIWALGGIVQKQMDAGLIPYVAVFSIMAIIVGLVLKKSGRLN